LLKAAIVILNYNGEKLLRTFIPSIVQHCPDWAELYVADNASTDGSLAFLDKHYPQVKLIILDANHGFAGGYNKALRQIDAQYYALVNNDLEVTAEWLTLLVGSLDNDPVLAAVQPKIRDYNNRNSFEYAGASGGFLDIHGYAFCRGRLFGHCERDIGQHDDPREVFWATGACFVVRSKDFWAVEGFDEDLFAHMEEIDFCWRLKGRGLRIYCNPAAVVYHLGGGTLGMHSPRKTYLNFRNNLAIIIKNDYRKRFWGKLLKRMILDSFAAFQFFFSRGPMHFFAVLKAHASIYLHLRKHFKKRRYWMGKATDINLTGRYRSNVVLDFYVHKKRVFGALQSALFVRTNRKHPTH
jgi:hypothetical protein